MTYSLPVWMREVATHALSYMTWPSLKVDWTGLLQRTWEANEKQGVARGPYAGCQTQDGSAGRPPRVPL